MANETIELLQNYQPKKMIFPAVHQEKIDGVPALIRYVGSSTTNPKPGWQAYTRQGNRITSIPHILEEVSDLFSAALDTELVMELYIDGQPFKYIGGRVRQIAPCNELVGYLFDNWCTGEPEAEYARRMTMLRAVTPAYDMKTMRHLPYTVVQDEEAADTAHETLMSYKPKAEGSVYHSCKKKWEPSVRSWQVQKRKPLPTIDLRIVGFEEAVSEAGQPLGMVGRVLAELASLGADGRQEINIVGIGPGKLTHPERKAIWAEFNRRFWKPRIAEVKYMRDDTYDALRQPTFQTWRDDKSEPDTYERAA